MKPLLFVCWLLPLMLAGQTEKSIHPVNSTASSPHGATYAVVIGISDYEDPKIPDLRFADRDAQAFYHWLHDPQGCGLPDSSLQLLTNQKATTAQMIMAMDWLIERCKPGDQAFLYFSGHGDVERITQFQRGYLLSYNSPPAVYGAGAFSLAYLQDIITTLSDKGVQVFVITDACRAGKLAGSSINGAQATSAQLAHQFAHEIKILSCQPEEYSLEGEQWGGGRGCFSFHLEDALYGFADENHDARVDLRELRRYLEDHVSKEAAPQNQSPMVMGPAQTTLATVQESVLSARQAAKGKNTAPFFDIDAKGMESFLLAKTDSSTRRLYARFLAAIDSGQLLSPPGRSADAYFRILMEKPEMASLYGVMKRKLAAALMDEGQTVVNKILKTDPEVLDNIWANRVYYDHLPAYFQRAAEILGEGHYAYKDIKAKEYLFRAITVQAENSRDSTVDRRLKERNRLLEKSLTYDSMSAVTYYLMGYYPGYMYKGLAKFKKAAELSPNWALIHFCLGFDPVPSTAIYHFKKSIELDSNFLRPFTWLAYRYDEIGKKDSAILCRQLYVSRFEQKINNDSTSIRSYDYNDIGNILWRLGDYTRAKAFLLLGEKVSKGNYVGIYGNLVSVNTDLLEFDHAVRACENVMRLTGLPSYGDNPGKTYFYFLNDTINAIAAWAKAEDQIPTTQQIQAWYTMGHFSKVYSLAQGNLKPSKYNWVKIFYIAESARQMGMADTARFYFNLIVRNVGAMRKGDYSNALDWRLKALALDRIGNHLEFQQVLDSVSIGLAGEPWLYFHLACVYAQTEHENLAIESFQKAIELGWKPYPLGIIEGTLCDPMLYPICEHEPFKNLVRQHFPKYYDIATRIPGKQ